MVVLENRADLEANRRWLANEQELTGRLTRHPIRLNHLAERLALPLDGWRSTFDQFLDYAPNRTIAYFLLSTCFGRLDAVDWEDLAPRNGSRLAGWVKAELIDSQVQQFVHRWHQQPIVERYTHAFGVNIASGLEYELQRQLLIQAYRAFEGMV